MIGREHARAESQHASGASGPGRMLSILGPVEKSSFFDVALGRRKINKKSSLGAQRAAKKCQGWLQGGDFGGQGSKGASRAVLLNNKTTKQQAVGALSATPTADGQANFLLHLLTQTTPCSLYKFQ